MKIGLLVIFMLFMKCSPSGSPEREIIRAEVYFNPIGFSPLFRLTAEEIMNENKKCEIVTQEILSKMEVKTLSLLESEKGEIPNRIDFVCRIIYKTGKPDLIVGTPLHLEYKGHLEIIDDSFAKMLYLTCGEEPRRMIN